MDSRDKLIYYKGDGTVLARTLVDTTKALLRGYPVDANQQIQIQYLANVRDQMLQKDLNDFPGKVLTMLEQRLGVNVQTQTQAVNQPAQRVQPQHAAVQTGGQQGGRFRIVKNKEGRLVKEYY
jgi:hypothetical protein